VKLSGMTCPRVFLCSVSSSNGCGCLQPASKSPGSSATFPEILARMGRPHTGESVGLQPERATE
jgi:hypothetical protein